MRVPAAGQPLDERRIVREGKALAERMLAGYAVTANGRFVPETEVHRLRARLLGRMESAAQTLALLYRRAGNGLW